MNDENCTMRRANACVKLGKCSLCALLSVRRLGNQLPVLGKANSLCKIMCVLPVLT